MPSYAEQHMARVLAHYSKPTDLAAAVTVSERELIKKALGVGKGFRLTKNRYRAQEGGSAHRAFEAMAERNLAVVTDLGNGTVECKVTKLGFAAAQQPTRKKAKEA